jgi:hypothetical protein
MLKHPENILLLEHHPERRSQCASALCALGYPHVIYVNFARCLTLPPVRERIDAVVAVWTDLAIDFSTVLHMVGKATDLPHGPYTQRLGALVVSPFSTEEHASLLRHCGARAWVRYPFLTEKFGRRLRYLIDGDRRRHQTVFAHDRRREPIYPHAA